MKRKSMKIKKKNKQRKRVFFLLAELSILIILIGVSFMMFKYGKLQKVNFGDGDIKINEGIDKEGYTTVALFGGDSREGALEEGTHADTIIIAAVNNKSGDIRLASVYRDTITMQANNKLAKANNAYFVGGPKEAINLLNKNMDLDIENYVTVDFKAMADVVDLLEGIEVDVSEEEADAMNLYLEETANVTGKTYESMNGQGTYNLNGVEAVTYARIRKLEGGDYKRTERQRLVVEKIFNKLKKSELKTLNNIANKVFPQVSTSFSLPEIIGLASGVTKYKLGETTGYPFDRTDGNFDNIGSIVVPVGVVANVKQLHQFLYPDKEYIVTNTVEEIEKKIESFTGITRDELEETQDNEVQP